MIIHEKDGYNIYLSQASDGDARDEGNPAFQDFYFVQQVHGNEIHCLEKRDEIGPSRTISADGILTNLPGVKIAIKLADCNGVLIRWREHLAIVHAGWKGLRGGIIQKCVEMLLERWETAWDVTVFVWPSIRSCCYEVGEEFLGRFPVSCFRREEPDKENAGKLYLDMIGVIRKIAEDLGISENRIEVSDICTKCGGGHFSYRWGDLKPRFMVGGVIVTSE